MNHIFNWLISNPDYIYRHWADFTVVLFVVSWIEKKFQLHFVHDVHFCLHLAFFAALAAWVIGIIFLRKKFLLKNAQGVTN